MYASSVAGIFLFPFLMVSCSCLFFLFLVYSLSSVSPVINFRLPYSTENTIEHKLRMRGCRAQQRKAPGVLAKPQKISFSGFFLLILLGKNRTECGRLWKKELLLPEMSGEWIR